MVICNISFQLLLYTKNIHCQLNFKKVYFILKNS
nr:MAG TPA_asm: hypothetical protein [Caudoviricetes sp.]